MRGRRRTGWFANSGSRPRKRGSAAQANEDAVLKVERRVVRAGDTREDRVAVVEGVEPGETIVTEGQLKLQSGARVRIDPAARLEPPAVRPKE